MTLRSDHCRGSQTILVCNDCRLEHVSAIATDVPADRLFARIQKSPVIFVGISNAGLLGADFGGSRFTRDRQSISERNDDATMDTQTTLFTDRAKTVFSPAARPLQFYLLVGSLWSLLIAHTSAQVPTFLIPRNANWKYATGDTKPPDGWKNAEFDDATWKAGPAGFGYGDEDDATVLADMPGNYTAVYIRRHFEVQQPDGIESLYLYVQFDDGFIAYLNGKQIAIAAVKRDSNRIRVEQHEAAGYEAFEIRNAKSLLKRGTNLLAIEGHNVSLDSSDFSLHPLLATSKIDDPATSLSVADFLADIDELERRLLDQSSYLTRLGFDHHTALSKLRQSINSETKLDRFRSDVEKLVMQIGDCHASVHSTIPLPMSRSLPLRPADTASGVAALGINLDQPLDLDCPYLETLDGLPLQRWLDVAAAYVPRGSPQLVRRRALERLGQIDLLREELQLPASEFVTIGLRSAEGSQHSTRRLRLTNQGYAVAQVRLRPSRMLAGQVGYLRIAAMDDRLIESTVNAIKRFRDTNGLIIDVRNNSGGNYGIMRGIYGFFVPDDTPPHVTNIAAFRLSKTFGRDHIEYRPTFRADWDGWNQQERDAIRHAAANFKPSWQLPKDQFSEWHYMVLSRERSGRASGAGDYFFYNKPVVVLSNAGSFSAADGFLNAFADLPQVRIVGEPSGGGSGATRQFQLPKTRLDIALSSMASYRPNGKLFDGSGIEVDLAVQPRLEDYTSDTDSVLERGISVIKEQSQNQRHPK